jgi:hypothetical protein
MVSYAGGERARSGWTLTNPYKNENRGFKSRRSFDRSEVSNFSSPLIREDNPIIPAYGAPGTNILAGPAVTTLRHFCGNDAILRYR